MNILVSACLLGIECRYNQTGEACSAVEALRGKHQLIPVCPEIYGGLVVNREGEDVTKQYRRGAEAALRLAQYFDCTVAILKERSPSCGYGRIHDGSFAGGMTDGNGVTAQLLSEHGIRILGETQMDEIRKL